jgi:hypothetical protein
MTRRNQWGESIDVANLGAGLVRAFPAGRAATPPVEWRRFCLNGNAPSAQFQNQLHAATNQAVLQRSRQLFASIAHPNEMAASSSSQPTFRFAFRTSTYHSGLVVWATMQPPLGANGDNASYARLKIFSDTAEAVTVKTTDFHYGAAPTGVTLSNTRGWAFAKTVKMYIAGLSPDTNYYALFSSESAGCLQDALVVEQQSMTEHFSGYLPTNLNQDSEVVSLHREKVATIQKNLWKHSGRHLINWTVSDGLSPLTRTSAVAINIVDNSSTAVSASTPGYTLDLRYRDRLMQTTGIPCKISVFGKSTVAGTGAVYFKDSTGALHATVSGFGTTAGWVTATVNLSANLEKHDLQFASNGAATFSLYAVSIYEYET